MKRNKMTRIYKNALKQVKKRKDECNDGYRMVNGDELSESYYKMEYYKAHNLELRIEKRIDYNSNVIKVDFINKKRVA